MTHHYDGAVTSYTYDGVVQVTLAAHGTIFNTLVTLYQVFQGVGTALCCTTGLRVGNGKTHEIPALVGIAVCITIVFASGLSTSLYFGRVGIARLFIKNATVVDVVDHSMLGAAVSLPGYAFLMTLAGACRGAGKQRIIAVGTLIGYAVGIPLAWHFGYTDGITPADNGLLGVWYGNAVALGIAASLAVVQVLRIDWKGLVSAVEPRSRSTSGLGNVSKGKGGGAAVEDDRWREHTGEHTRLLVQMADGTE